MPLKIYQKEDAGAKYWAKFWKEREKSLEEQQQYMEFNFLTKIISIYHTAKKSWKVDVEQGGGFFT